MNGIYTASGIDYQREIFLFIMLKYLLEKILIDAEMEVFIENNEEIKINIDFLISKKENQKEEKGDAFIYRKT